MRKYGIFLLAAALAACTAAPDVEPGVSRTLAQERAGRVSNIVYDLAFTLPEALDEPCKGTETLSFDLEGKGALLLDFRPGAESVHSLTVNGKALKPDVRDEHIVLPARSLRPGRNEVSLSFTPDDAPLNRRPGYLYTLLVPERARTLFPCFDQPDLKARFNLGLDIPEKWTAVANGPLREENVTEGRRHLTFGTSGLLSTYLFEFTAGEWRRYDFDRNGAPMRIYYRETDPAKIAQLPEIQRQILYALDWLEEFTGIPMPFEKYDCVIVPGFQFGGMEHPGAILFADTRMFLGEAPTDADRLSRIDLIAHETAHLWFGDAVTMRWFDDVWTKEVFANHFSAWITRPLFPEIDYRLRDFRSFNIPAYAEDRTSGSTPIRQQLDNLQDAGLVYGNIVYDKAPVVMRMLADTLGKDTFRDGIREYLKTYLYGNATWPELIEILDRYTDADLKDWSRRWVEEKGMPVYPVDKGLANLDALGYGYYELSEQAVEEAFDRMATLPEAHQRLSTLANLYENMLHHRVQPLRLAGAIGDLLRQEDNPLVAASALSYLTDIAARNHRPAEMERQLRNLAADRTVPQQIRLSAFRSLEHLCTLPETTDELWHIWKDEEPWTGLSLAAEDYTTLALECAVRFPDRYESIRKIQRNRISNPDRLARFDFVFPSVHPDRAVRDSVFRSLLEPKNRGTEPWVQESLRCLNHPLRQEEALDYLVPGLDEMQENQRTGDIFFPKNWIVSILSGHDSPEAAGRVKGWLEAHPDYPPLLLNKILQAADPLLRQP